jgi:DNA repair exonuclease SbcCD ATPase subunit
MGIPYKKDYIKSDGRQLLRGGPRDMQARLNSKGYADSEIIDLLKAQIDDLRYELRNKHPQQAVPEGYFTPEQVDAEIRKAVEQAVSEAALSFKSGGQKTDPLVREYKTQIVELQQGNDNLQRLKANLVDENTMLKDQLKKVKEELDQAAELKTKLAILEQQLADKDEMINLLKSRPAILNTTEVENRDPKRPQMEQVFVDPLEKDSGDGLKSTIRIEEIKSEGEVDDKVKKLKDLLGNKLPK